jgi:DNA topoisomerase-1
LLETTFIRVGNEEYKKENESYGLTTLEDRHVNVDGPRMKFKFKGKSGQTHEIELEDRRVARIVKRCQDLPGYELFQYLDQNGETCGIDSGDVNDYLREITGEDFTAKDFRTWAGTILAAEALVESGACEDSAEIKKRIVAAVKDVASRLGNRPATCRKYYVHPAIFDAYTNGILTEAMRNGKVEPAAQSAAGLRKEELCVLGVIRQAVLEEPVALPKAG